jgi:hypothetical protein
LVVKSNFALVFARSRAARPRPHKEARDGGALVRKPAFGMGFA